MYYLTINSNSKITGFHYNLNKDVLEDNEIAITEEIYNNYVERKLSIIKYKYDDVNGIVDNAKLVE
jgi:hypothetical protein